MRLAAVLRLLAIMLLIANVAMFFAARDSASAAGSQPDKRVAGQLHAAQLQISSREAPPPEPVSLPGAESPSAETETVATPAPTSATTPEVPAADASKSAKTEAEAASCRLLAGLNEKQLDTYRDLIKENHGAVELSETTQEGSKSYWLHVPAFANRQQAERRAAEIKTLGVADVFVTGESHPTPNSLSLGLYKNEAVAEEAKKKLVKLGITNAVIEERSASRTFTLTLRGKQAAIDKAQAGLKQAGATSVASCDAVVRR